MGSVFLHHQNATTIYKQRGEGERETPENLRPPVTRTGGRTEATSQFFRSARVFERRGEQDVKIFPPIISRWKGAERYADRSVEELGIRLVL